MSDDIFAIMDSMDSKQNKSDDIFSALEGSDDNELMQMMSQNPKTSIGQDIQSGISNIPSTVWEMAKEFPSEAYGAAKQAVTDPKRVGQNLLSGLAQMGHGVLNTPANIVDYLKQKDVLPDYIQAARQPEYDFASMTGRQGSQPGDALISGTAEYLPYLLSAGVGAAGRGAFANALRQAGASAANAVGQNENPITAAGTMGIADLGLRGFGNALSRARNINPADLNPLRYPEIIASRFGGDLNPRTAAELAERLRVTRGTQTPLGDVLGSPVLKKTFENAVAPQALSGAENIFKSIEEQIRNRANNIVATGPDAPLHQRTYDSLNRNLNQVSTVKNRLWNEVNNAADNEAFNLELPSFNRYATENAAAIESSPFLQMNPKFNNIYRDLVRSRENTTNTALPGNGIPSGEYMPPSIRDAKLLANQFYNEGRKMNMLQNSSSERAVGRHYQQLSERLNRDIADQVALKGSPELQNAYNTANDFHRDVYSRFLNKDLAKLIDRGKDPQNIINEIIKPGKSADKFRMIDRVNNLLSPNERNLVAQGYLQKSFDKRGDLDINSLNKQINSLGPQQFRALFPENTRQNILDFQDLLKMNSEAVHRMNNPKTGFRAAGLLPSALSAAGGGALGGPIGALAGAAASQGLARALTRAATSEPFREAVVNRKLNNFQEALRNRNNTPLLDGRQNLLLEGLAGALVPPNNVNKTLVSY